MQRQSVNLRADVLLSAYSQGAFPMAGHDGVVQWYSADPRGIIPLDRFHIPRTLRQVVSQRRFDIRINHDFEAVVRACATGHDDGTWISESMIKAYVALHRLGHAHSVEAWRDGELAGGLYGVSLGGAFFGESMFHRVTDASKVALVHLVQRLVQRDFELLDTQANSRHLRRFGCIEIPAAKYLQLLERAIRKESRFDG